MTNSPFDPATTVIEDIAGDYTLDVTHTRLGFSARHAMVTTVRGAFTAFEGTAHIDTANPAASTVALTIKADSIDTGVADRDGHLHSADFFDVETYPEITFVSTDVSRDGDDWTITGDLTIKDVTKPIELAVEFLGVEQNAYGQTVIGFEASASISRKEWGIDFNVPLEGGKLLIGDKVDIHLDIQAALQA